MSGAGEVDRVGLAELIGALSLGIDLGFGQPMEHVLRQCWIALRVAEHLGLDEEQRSVVYYTALLTCVGCHTDAHEQAKWLGDDIGSTADEHVHGPRGVRPAMARSLAREIGLPVAVQDAVAACDEHWDGKGWPGERAGDAIPIAARVSQLAGLVEVAHRSGGVCVAAALARKRSGGQLDPNIAVRFAVAAGQILDGLDGASTWDQVIGAEPVLSRPLSGGKLDEAIGAVADFVDLRSPFTLGHARGVAQLVDDAGVQLGLGAGPLRTLRRAGLAHGLGRLGVSNAIWDKPGPLGAGEWERVRLQPYLTERILQQSPALAAIGAVAAQLRERLDGSGYPRGLSSGGIALPARVLGAADVYQSMLEHRAHRPARSPEEAAVAVRAEVRAGRLDGDAAEAVLVAAGHRVRVRRERPAGLTEREVEVLRLVARGRSSKEIAADLVISPKTVRNHIEHIYVKTGATSRVTASLFAIAHDLTATRA
jgi:HD-GYP domain-containing protein (c-di-GMP phosphodiesterase class II)